MTAATFVDVAGLFKAWLNSRTGTLVGATHPITAGFHLNHIGSRGGKMHTYGLLVLNGGGGLDVAEGGVGRATVSAQIYGPTQKLASDAAAAYANELLKLDRPTTLAGGTLLGAGGITYPLYAQDRDVPRYLVDCVLLVKP